MSPDASDPTKAPRKARPRSPSYPAVSLEDAIQRASVLYAKENRHAAPFEVILAHWGYTPRSGAGSVVLAALRKYGLLVYEGRTARLSDLAFRILWDEEDSDGRRTAIKEAALNPRIHEDLWLEYKGLLPSDATLRLELRRRGFAETAISDFIEQYRATLLFAGLTQGGTEVSSHDGPTKPQLPAATPIPASPNDHTQFPNQLPAHGPIPPAPIQLPLVGGSVVTIQASGPVTEAAWDQMMEVLKALKTGFVSPSPASTPPESD